jgi:hypothetical protein
MAKTEMDNFVEQVVSLVIKNKELPENEIKAYIRELLSEKLSSAISKHVAILTEVYEDFKKTHEFKPGDLVEWKKGLKNRKLPPQGFPAIVIQVLKEPIYDTEKDSGSAYFREPLDIVLGIIEREGVFNQYYYDSRRFEPYTG